jgi:hypothetical protein
MANFESPDDMMLQGPKGTRKRSKTVNEMSSKELQNYAMKYARENKMSETAAIELFSSKIKKKQAEESKGKKMSKGGDATKKDVPVIAISIGMGKMKKPEKKTKMMRGGMANGKEHMYSAGGMVNDGLKALKKASPEAYNKITGN